MKWRMLVWGAVVIAAAAAIVLGAVAVMAGLTAASGLAGVIAGFCELAAVALAVIGWAGEHRPAADAGKEQASASPPSTGQSAPSQDPAGHRGGKYTVTLGDNAHGTVIGDGNVVNVDLHHPERGRAQSGAGESG